MINNLNGAHTPVGTAAQCAAEVRNPLTTSVDELIHAIYEAHNTFEVLREKLRVVMTPEPAVEGSTAGKAIGTPVPSTAPLVIELDYQRARVRDLTVAMHAVIDRLAT